MQILNHPKRFKEGIRILHLVSRNKDSGESKTHALEISRSAKEFDLKLEKLTALSPLNSRIYASLSQRDIHKAMRLFKERQLAADYDESPWKFYNNLQARWISCLANPKCVLKEDKLWMFDCDSESEHARAALIIDNEILMQQIKYNKTVDPNVYQYETKSGSHIIVNPFNMSNCVRKEDIHKNPLMLWGY